MNRSLSVQIEPLQEILLAGRAYQYPKIFHHGKPMPRKHVM